MVLERLMIFQTLLFWSNDITRAFEFTRYFTSISLYLSSDPSWPTTELVLILQLVPLFSSSRLHLGYVAQRLNSSEILKNSYPSLGVPLWISSPLSSQGSAIENPSKHIVCDKAFTILWSAFPDRYLSCTVVFPVYLLLHTNISKGFLFSLLVTVAPSLMVMLRIILTFLHTS